MEQPIVYYTPSIGPSGIVFYTGTRYPGWKNNLFVSGLVGQQLRRLEVGGGTVSHQEVLFNQFGRVHDVVQGPDGYLYVTFQLPGQPMAASTPGMVARLIPAVLTSGRPCGQPGWPEGRAARMTRCRTMRSVTIRASLILLCASSFAGSDAFQAREAWPPPVRKTPEKAPVLSAEEEQKTFVLPPGYRVELVAKEPLVIDPIAIDFDADGRMWVVEMPGFMSGSRAR